MDIPQHIVPYLKKAYDDLQEPLTKFLRDANLIGSYATLHRTSFHQYLLSQESHASFSLLIFSAFGMFSVFDLFLRKTSKSATH